MKKIDLSGNTFGLLKVLKKIPGSKYKCECACGKVLDVSANYLNSKSKKKSCGCIDIQFKGVSLGYILGYRKVNNTTGVEGIHREKDNTYTVHINLYDKCLYIGKEQSLKKANELREWGENTFYKPILDEYLKLKKELRLEDIPISKRIGDTTAEIIRNHILSLGKPTQVEINKAITEAKEKIKFEVKKDDLSNQTFGELKVLYRLPPEYIEKNGKMVQLQTKYRCKCSCGKCKDVREHSLKGNKTLSCGCLSTERFKGRLLGSILGTARPKTNTGIEGITEHKSGKYTVHINLYGQFFNLGTRNDFEDAKKLFEWGETTFYKPISDEYFELKKTLKPDDIPVDMREGDTDEEIISNYLSAIGQTPQEEINSIIEETKNTIKEYRVKEKANRSVSTRSKRTEESLLVGQTFGEITVINRLQKKIQTSDSTEKFIPSTKYNCLCSCGKRLELEGYLLKSKIVKSCGCILRGQFKGVSLGYILGYKKPTTNTGIMGVNVNQGNKYLVSISLYAKNISIGIRNTLSEAKALREWAENTFYKPVIDEYFDLKENLKVDDIPVSLRKGEIDKEIIGNYITLLGTKSQEQIEEEIKNAREEIKNMKMNIQENISIIEDTSKEKESKRGIFKRKINGSPRKVKLNKEKIQLFNSKEKPNPCGCGSQQYYKTDNGTFIIDVCSSCGKDICISPKKKDFSEWKLETELNI